MPVRLHPAHRGADQHVVGRGHHGPVAGLESRHGVRERKERRHLGRAALHVDADQLFEIVLGAVPDRAFVSVDAMPGWFQPIARYPSFTPAMTLRGLLGTGIGDNRWITVLWGLGPGAWGLGLAALGHRWSKAVFDRDPK